MSSIDHQEVEPEERESAWEDTEEEIDESDSIWEDAEEEIEDTDSVWEDTDEEIDEDDAAQPQLTMIDLSRSWFSPIIPLNNVKSNCNLPAMSRLAPPVNLDVGSCLAGFQLSLVEIITVCTTLVAPLSSTSLQNVVPTTPHAVARFRGALFFCGMDSCQHR